jgi:hypothetical protein
MIFGAMVYVNYRDTRVKNLVLRTSSAVSARRDEADIQDLQISRATLYGNAILGGMIGYLATSTFISTLYYPTFWIMMALAVALRNTTQAMPSVSSGCAAALYAKSVSLDRDLGL